MDKSTNHDTEVSTNEKTYTGSRASHEDQRPQIRRTLVAEGSRSIDQSTDAIGLNGRADEGRAPSGGCTGSFLALGELLFGVGGLSAVVGVAEDGSEDGERGGVGEDRAEGDRGGLDGWEVCRRGRKKVSE